MEKFNNWICLKNLCLLPLERASAMAIFHIRYGIAARSQLPMFGKRMDPRARDDEVVEQADIDQCQGLFQCAREQEVRFAGFGGARRMVVGQHDAGRVGSERFLHYFARIHAGMTERTAEHFLGGDQAILDVEEEHDERFVALAAEQHAQVILDRFRRTERPARL